MRTPAKLGLLTSLYFSQGLPFGFFTQALPVLLRQRGVDLGMIGLTSLLALPWALKFLWAPLVDRHWLPSIGRRRSWILPLQGLTAMAMVLVALLDPEQQLGLVLASFLPHTDTEGHRADGAWINGAGAINGTIRGWFKDVPEAIESPSRK